MDTPIVDELRAQLRDARRRAKIAEVRKLQACSHHSPVAAEDFASEEADALSDMEEIARALADATAAVPQEAWEARAAADAAAARRFVEGKIEGDREARMRIVRWYERYSCLGAINPKVFAKVVMDDTFHGDWI